MIRMMRKRRPLRLRLALYFALGLGAGAYLALRFDTVFGWLPLILAWLALEAVLWTTAWAAARSRSGP
jgi:hypothetical protein